MGRSQRQPRVARVFLAYVYVMRCTPSIVLLFIVFYGAPKLVFALFDYDMMMHRAVFAVVTFTLLFGIHFRSVFRAAYTAVPRIRGGGEFRGRHSAMSCSDMALIARRISATLTINLLKEALAHTIGLIDLIKRGSRRTVRRVRALRSAFLPC